MTEYKIEDTITFQPAKFRLFKNDKEIKLSQKESEVLALLCKNTQHVVERKVFLHNIWGNREGGDISLNQSVLTLRRKFESLGYLNGIDTIPRIGYMFRLKTITIEVKISDRKDGPRHNMESATSPLLDQRHIAESPYKRVMLTLLFVLMGILPFFLFKIHNAYVNNEQRALSYRKAYENKFVTILELADLKHMVNYKDFLSLLPLNKKMQISISNLAISFIEETDGNQMWSNVFILDQKNNINTQLICIAKYLQQIPTVTEKDDTMFFFASASEHGPVFHKKRFYSACLDTRPNYIGEMKTNSTPYPRNMPKSNQPFSLIQDVSFYDDTGNPIFHFKTVSRVKYFYEGKNELDFFVHLKTKSLKAQFIDQGKLSKNKYINMIFNEYETDNMYLKSLMSTDGQSVTILSSAFDGTLSQGVIIK